MCIESHYLTVPLPLSIHLTPFKSPCPPSGQPFLAAACRHLLVLQAQLFGSSISLSSDVQMSLANFMFMISSVSVSPFHEADSQHLSAPTSPTPVRPSLLM
jgi:hypothetical protein